MTLTTHMQPAGACTTICWAPGLVTGVTAEPDPVETVIVGVPLGAAPAATTKTWKAGPEAGAGVH